MIGVLVVDDHDLIRAGISRMLEDDGAISVLGEACSGEEALGKIKDLKPDVVLMDIKMPGMGGLEATRRIKQAAEGIQVVVVSGCTESSYVQRVLDSGASAFISKKSHISEIVSGIHKVSEGGRYLSSDVAQSLVFYEKRNPFDELSDRELQIATMVIECYKVQDISDALCLSPKTVNSYRYRIFEKLGINSDVELTLQAVKHGLLEVDAVQ